ncbi:aspartate/glutamate racemase family protein [Rhizobium johnstonii]|mgnify:CR=1 FL=1|uniref:aspartate/glutamate racemase family protein n=1 Tax=Rhizobium TaxID=379 RepID=UPI00040375F9|nr:aspartate/glutamate racemase family protein [Rhizobium leguminosarum]MBY5376429.1 hydrogenase expression protein HupH [Rhizobium leguminosarum]TBF90672.1 hydrogenase expression protein HupH [Rhizobium leguminosarum]TBG56690.1 hydrogenase expression protein HupH [Rhizobium leguminosarum]TBG73079.1 hydrogenase expression protein HupH [Rhizobium leguminosarum]
MQDSVVEIRVVSPIVTKGFRKVADLRALECPGIKVSHAQITAGPGSIESEFEAALSVPGTIAEAIKAQNEGVHAIIIDCMGDPGLRPSREAVTIPVLGPCETGMHLAAMLGHRFSVLTVMRRLRASFENTAAVAGLSTKLASVRSVDIPVLELEEDLDRTKAMLIKEGIRAVEEDGAEALVFGCTGLMGCAFALREGLLAHGIDVPVVDPIPAAVSVAAALVRSNLAHSKLTFPQPPEKQLLGYDYIHLPMPLAAE